MMMSSAGHPVFLPAGRLRVVLCVLALAGGATVSTDRLMFALWDEDLPERPLATLQTIVSRLRSRVGEGIVLTEPGGYRLAVGADAVDALRFERLTQEALDARADAAGKLDAALALWRGEPFADLDSRWLRNNEAPRLTTLYLEAVELRTELALEQGSGARQLPILVRLVSDFPLRETLWCRLIDVLAAAGRPAEALAQYERARLVLSDELGVDPGTELRSRYQRLLGAESLADRTRHLVPRQLPGNYGIVVGRESELANLDRLLADASTGAAVITGTAGVGKTTLAVSWARRVAARFPGGQLFVNLRGFEPNAEPVGTDEAARWMLDALGVEPESMPAGVPAQSALLRTLLSERKVLVVLDNARDAQQVRPLLPGSTDSFALVTSRDRLTPLIVAGAGPVVVSRFSRTQSVQLLESRLGDAVVEDSRDVIPALTEATAGLPLALAVVAARAAASAPYGLQLIAAELSDGGHALDVLSGSDSVTDLRTVLSWSYRAMPDEVAKMFRLLALHPGPEFGHGVAASLLGIEVQRARLVLRQLQEAHLVEGSRPGHFFMHDLLRAYAAEVASAAERRDAVVRLVDHHLHTSTAAALVINPGRVLELSEPPAEGVRVLTLTARQRALDWFAENHRVLVRIVDLAVATGHDRRALELIAALRTPLNRSGRWQHWHDWVHLQAVAVDAARRLDDREAEANALLVGARAHGRLTNYAKSIELGNACITICHELNDRHLEASACQTLANAASSWDRQDLAESYSLRALELYRLVGDEFGEVVATHELGYQYALLGQYDEALQHCQYALERMEAGAWDQLEIAAVWDSLGFIHLRMSAAPQAISCYQRAADLYHAEGDQYYTAMGIAKVGDAYASNGNTEQARHNWLRAAHKLEALQHPDAATVRARLGQLAFLMDGIPSHSEHPDAI
ncbi:AfsR/SARP family transcriptional regulator [Kribbella solani]|uniref:DNA-binding SARP family transcriptional activator n=1 Tax=Kribbella solani TaxID=236067 RepID=A0A841DLK5_9ACTN|nr:BTAD domain-containing putative transcriptional regulator [Kribbella solani]MBB5977317.1 DNA-binding SARP family transcriptional activator [Kribbella solani]